MNFIEMNVGGVPVHRIAFHHQFVVRPPRFHFEWAASNDVCRVGPLFAVFFYDLARRETKELVRQQPSKVRRRLRKRNADRVIIDCLDADVLRANRNKFRIADGSHCRLQPADSSASNLLRAASSPGRVSLAENALIDGKRCPAPELVVQRSHYTRVASGQAVAD